MEQVLTFKLGEELYGLRISAIQEIVESPRLFYIPGAPGCYLGAINFHGTILPVLDLPGMLDFESAGRDDRIVVINSAVAGLGLSVSCLGEILALPETDSLPCDEELGRTHFIQEVVDHDGKMINLLDMGLLLARLERM